jgi:hypothetical protein
MENHSSPFGNGSNALLLATSLLAGRACNDEKLCQRVLQDTPRFIALSGLSDVDEASFLASFQAMLAKSRSIAGQSQQAASASGQLHDMVVTMWPGVAPLTQAQGWSHVAAVVVR